MNKQEVIAKNLGVEKVKFYYNDKDPVVNNLYTVCLFLSKDGKVLSRGVSICSVRDMHIKKDARDKSFGRALKALLKKSNNDPINPKHFTLETPNLESYIPVVVRKNGARIPLDYPLQKAAEFFTYKSEFEPQLTEKELRIISGKKLNS